MKKRLQLVILIPVLIFSCKTKNKNTSVTTGNATAIDTAQSSCPFLTKDNKNNIVLSWIRKLNDSTSVFCYAVSTDEGKTFGKAVTIPGSKNILPHGENLPKIIFKPSGEIIAAWGASNPNPANPYSGSIYYSQSFNEGKTWTKAKIITPDTASFDQRYFDMALLPNGEAAIVWLDNRKHWNKEGSGLYYAVTKNNSGFQNEKLIGGPCCECCRTDLFIDKDKNIHVAYRAIINDSIRDMVHIISTDKGSSFSLPKTISNDNWVINGCPHTGPAMAENKKGIFFTWFTGGNNAGTYFNCSTDNGKTFTTRNIISGRTAKHAQIISLKNQDLIMAWDEGFLGGNKYNNRIGIEEYDAERNTLKNYITSKTSNAAFPVMCAINNKVVIAYTEDINNKTLVLYRALEFKQE